MATFKSSVARKPLVDMKSSGRPMGMSSKSGSTNASRSAPSTSNGSSASNGSSSASTSSASGEPELTVEKYLEQQCGAIIKDLREHGAALIGKLRGEFKEQSESILDMMKVASAETICVTLKVTAGPHLGQKFRLEAGSASGDDVFKVGRSTGKQFKEKGVSMYKDKEISTTHAKVETRNGQVFLTDVKSTNGTSVNGEAIRAQCPVKLSDGDLIQMGSSEIAVCIVASSDDAEEELEDLVSL